MKINPVGIQSYQQLTGHDRAASRPESGPKTDKADPRVSITPHDTERVSALAVKPTGSDFSQFLSDEEKSALELLFNRFKDQDRFGAGYRNDTQSTMRQGNLGSVVDVKV